jgi:hypothetical protein
MTTAFSDTMKNWVSRGCGFCTPRVSFSWEWAKGRLTRFGAKSEEFQGGIWTQLRNSDTPSVIIPVETQNGVPSCVNTAYLVERDIKPCHLLLFDSASDMINEENMKTTTVLISIRRCSRS